MVWRSSRRRGVADRSVTEVVRSRGRESCLRVDTSREVDLGLDDRLGRRVGCRRRGLRCVETGRLSCLLERDRWR